MGRTPSGAVGTLCAVFLFNALDATDEEKVMAARRWPHLPFDRPEEDLCMSPVPLGGVLAKMRCTSDRGHAGPHVCWGTQGPFPYFVWSTV